jgi:predicted amidohydrolase
LTPPLISAKIPWSRFVISRLGVRFPSSAPPKGVERYPSWPKGADCKSAGSAFTGSNPVLSTRYGPLAQLVEHLTFNQGVPGSSPGWLTSNSRKKDNLYYNCTYILNPSIDYEQEEYIYAKVFLTPIEKNFFKQGTDKRLSIDTKYGRFGFLICYDLCFVELPRQYAYIDNVDAIITIAAWRSRAVREYSHMNTRTDHYYGFLWDLMNSSKSAYNQVWSLGVNWVGVHKKSGEYFWGGSGLWAPSGMKLLQASNINEELLIIRNIDIAGQRSKEKDDFNYSIDFDNFYRNLKHKEDCIYYPEGED